LNSRPLTYCSSDPNDEHVLPPNHFLYGQAGGQLAPRVIDNIAFNPKNRWRFVQDLISKCWKRWMKEYLSTLNTRSKWVEQRRNVAPGDVVLLVETSNPKGHWPLGRIQEVFPGPDGQSCTRQDRRKGLRETHNEIVPTGTLTNRKGTEVIIALFEGEKCCGERFFNSRHSLIFEFRVRLKP